MGACVLSEQESALTVHGRAVPQLARRDERQGWCLMVLVGEIALQSATERACSLRWWRVHGHAVGVLAVTRRDSKDEMVNQAGFPGAVARPWAHSRRMSLQQASAAMDILPATRPWTYHLPVTWHGTLGRTVSVMAVTIVGSGVWARRDHGQATCHNEKRRVHGARLGRRAHGRLRRGCVLAVDVNRARDLQALCGRRRAHRGALVSGMGSDTV